MKKMEVELVVRAIDEIATEGPVTFRRSEPVLFGTEKYGQWKAMLDQRRECYFDHQHVLDVMDETWMTVTEIVTFVQSVYGCHGANDAEVREIISRTALPRLSVFEFVEGHRALPLDHASKLWGAPGPYTWATVWNLHLHGVASFKALKLGLVEIAANWKELVDVGVQNEREEEERDQMP